MPKNSLFLLAILIFFLVFPFSAQALTLREKSLLLQRIEILKHEIQLLRSLILNLQKNQPITSPSYLVVDFSDNSFLLQKNINQQYSVASITKLMNAIIALEHIEKTETITLTKEMLEPLGHSPSLYLGLEVSAENLLKASLIQSTNDASEALAYFLGKEKFLNLMNEKAKELEMKNTVFYDTHGLSHLNRSTPSDLAKLLSYIYKKHPQILEITKNNDFWLPDSSGWLLKFQNVNNFYLLPEFIGGKTGYLPEAKQALASVFNVKEKPVAVILLYSDSRQADVFTVLKELRK